MKRSQGPKHAWLRLAPPALAAAFAAAAGGCNSYLFEQKCPEAIKESKISQPAATPTPADILFVVDNSGSMADEQENLARNFEAFINQIAGAGDYQIMVVTTDLESTADAPPGTPGRPLERAGLLVNTFATQEPFNLLANGISTAGCSFIEIEHGCARGPDPAKRIIKSSTMTKEEQIQAFQENVRVGSCGSGNERGLQGMMRGLERAVGSDCNSGFLRDGANLVVVLVSDEDDFTDGASPPVQQFIEDLARIKDFTRVRLAAIVGSVDGQGVSCRVNNEPQCGSLCQRMPPQGSHSPCQPGQVNQCPSNEICIGGQCENSALQFWTNVNCGWCSYYNQPDCCSALGGSRYVEFARLVEQRVHQVDSSIPISNCRGEPGTPIACLIDSICQEEFSGTLARIARELVITNSYTLSPPPVYPEGVLVKVGGEQLTYGTDFSISGAKLTINANKTPSEGQEVEIYYVTENTPTGSVPTGACVNN